MSASIPRPVYDLEISAAVAEEIGYKLASREIKVVKPLPMRVNSARRELLLRNVDYMESQIGRLAKMARDMRAEILLLTTE